MDPSWVRELPFFLRFAQWLTFPFRLAVHDLPGNTVQQLVHFRRIGLLCCFRSLEVWFQNSKYSHPKYPDPSKLAVLRTQPLLYRFKPFHWGVQWSLGQCMKKFLGMFEKKSLWKSLSILRLRKMRNSDSKVHVRPGSSWSLFEKNHPHRTPKPCLRSTCDQIMNATMESKYGTVGCLREIFPKEIRQA